MNGTVVARYDYDPWGRSTTVIGTTKPDFNFTGLYQHAKSGLDMAMYRAYDPDLGRWLSRDPIGERGGANLYGYVNNRPMNSTDLLGLLAQIYVYRTSPTSQASVVVYENNVYLGSTWGNQRGFYSDRAPHPPPDGIYGVTQRTDYQEGDNFANGTPRILDLGFIHPDSRSRGCLTVDFEWADRIWDIVERNADTGGTTITYITQPYPKAILNDGPLPAPSQHSWPAFHRIPPY